MHVVVVIQYDFICAYKNKSMLAVLAVNIDFWDLESDAHCSHLPHMYKPFKAFRDYMLNILVFSG